MNKTDDEKNILREKYILIRKEIENKKVKSKKICDRLMQNDAFKNSRVIALYKSLKSEVDTTELIENSIKIGKTVVLPKVEGNVLKFYKFNTISEKLLKSSFGVEEPLGEKETLIDKQHIDLVVVPGICFDIEKNRLGFGKGYYDRFLIGGNFKKIGLCFNEQIIERVPVNEYDVKLDEIITDEQIIC